MKKYLCICSCRRPHVFLVGPGIHRQPCGCGKTVTIHVPAPSRWTMLEVD